MWVWDFFSPPTLVCVRKLQLGRFWLGGMEEEEGVGRSEWRGLEKEEVRRRERLKGDEKEEWSQKRMELEEEDWIRMGLGIREWV